MNVFTATGNLGRDADVRATPSGLIIASFPVAVQSGYGDNRKTTWVRCSLFGKRAESKLVGYLVKGAQIAVSGELSLNEYTTKEGENRTTLELRVSEIDLIGGQQAQQPVQKTVQQPAQQPVQQESFDDEIPF